MKLQEPKVFTLAEARETLPLVSQILRDIIKLYSEQKEMAQLIKQTQDIEKRRELSQQEFKIFQQYQQYLDELSQVGCHIKNVETGIVGYYWDRGNGVIVELCWKYGETALTWHEIGTNQFYPI